MKKVLFLVALVLASVTSAFAQDKDHELTLRQKLLIAEAATAMVVGIPVLIGATVTGKKKELCDVMHGTYDLNATDQCKGGDWLRLIPYLKKGS